ncbi:MAG: LicD family protein [Erysipelotrichaceae bacterium]|nr:LicD family protein [Erysipelotrichaceae bacterium]
MIDLNLDISSDFFREEEKCGYLVKSEIKELWAVELDLLNELLKVCIKHDIKIMASAGTVLGAIRHKGFIPWDDDIDMFLSRKDYDKLCSLSNEFKYPYFFQTEYTDPGSMRGHAQLRNSKTTAMLQNEGKYAHFNQGIFIDIFPYDSVISDELKYKKQCKRINFYLKNARRLYRLTDGYKYQKYSIKRRFIRPFGILFNMFISYDNIYKKFEKECQKYNNNEPKVGFLSIFNNDERFIWQKEDLDEIIWVDFEMIKIPIPKKYDLYLKKMYGDYSQYVIGTSRHGKLTFDTNVNYKEYFRKISN